MRRVAALPVALVVATSSWACGNSQVPAATLGKDQFSNQRVSTSPLNGFSCATCHLVSAEAQAPADGGPHGGSITSGHDLHDVVHRPSWWGSYETTLLDAMNYCLTEFMGGGRLLETDAAARELYEYLAASSPDDPSPALPLTIVENVTDLAGVAGDAGRGEDVYGRACHVCHGEPHSGAGKIGRSSTIPEDTLAIFPTSARAVLVEKVRHGRFFNIGGVMPPFSAQTISDQEVADIAAYVGL